MLQLFVSVCLIYFKSEMNILRSCYLWIISVTDQASYQKHLHGGLEFVSSIPKSFTGKPLRAALRDTYAKRLQASQ